MRASEDFPPVTTMPGATLVLPFAMIESADRKGAPATEFPLPMTYATILGDIEGRRRKEGIFRKGEERIDFAAQLHWPLLTIPWDSGRYLVFDGMGVWSHVFERHVPPNVKGFLAEVRGASKHDRLTAILERYAPTFERFAGTESIAIPGLFIHEEFMSDLLGHISLARTADAERTSFLSPRLTLDAARKAADRMRDLAGSFETESDEIASVTDAVRAANRTAQDQIAKDRDAAFRDFTRQLDRLRPEVQRNVTRIEKERDDQWNRSQPEILQLQVEHRQYEAEVARAEREGDAATDPDARRAASDRARRSQDHMEVTARTMADLQRRVAEERSAFDRQTQTQWERVRSLERERETTIAGLNNEAQRLNAIVDRIAAGVSHLAKMKRAAAKFIRDQGVPIPFGEPVDTVYIPVFVAGLVAPRGHRILVYPPMVARRGKGMVNGIKSAFGGIVLPLEPRTEKFDEIFRGGIEKAVGSDASLTAYLGSAGMRSNVLHQENLAQVLAQGLALLKHEGWIKDRHERDLLASYSRHVTAAQGTAPR